MEKKKERSSSVSCKLGEIEITVRVDGVTKWRELAYYVKGKKGAFAEEFYRLIVVPGLEKARTTEAKEWLLGAPYTRYYDGTVEDERTYGDVKVQAAVFHIIFKHCIKREIHFPLLDRIIKAFPELRYYTDSGPRAYALADYFTRKAFGKALKDAALERNLSPSEEWGGDNFRVTYVAEGNKMLRIWERKKPPNVPQLLPMIALNFPCPFLWGEENPTPIEKKKAVLQRIRDIQDPILRFTVCLNFAFTCPDTAEKWMGDDADLASIYAVVKSVFPWRFLKL